MNVCGKKTKKTRNNNEIKEEKKRMNDSFSSST